MAVVVRRAAVDDADAIGVVHVRAWQAAYRGLMSDEHLDGLSTDQRIAGWREGLAERAKDRAVLVVEDPADGRVCGFAVVGDVRTGDGSAPVGEGELWAINLEPGAWGRGLASALLAGAVDELSARGCTEAHLWVLDGNARARRFYEREGWAPDGGVKHQAFGDRTLREVRYRRALSGAAARD